MEYGISVFKTIPEDSKALVFTPEAFGAFPDGIGDNTQALQRAIDEVERRFTIGILFIPEGKYKLCGSINLWRGIRLIGVGEKRPVFFLEDHAEGFEGPLSSWLFFCRNVKPAEGEFLRDANECSFFTALRNLDIDLGVGNAGAVAVRYHIAQLCSLEDCDFYIGDGKAAVEYVGNEVERCRFFGGTYGIIGYYTAPGWQFYVGDCVFEGQRRAGIMSGRTGLTLVRNLFRNMPWAVYVPNKELYDVPMNETERLYMEDCRAEDISTAVVSMGWVRNVNNWLHVTGTICRNAPMFLECFGYQFVYFFMEPPIRSEYPCYSVQTRIGFGVKADNRELRRKFQYEFEIKEAAWTAVPEPDYRAEPDPSEWTNVCSFGAVGDGVTDDTEAILTAVESADTIYFPQGIYRISRTVKLRENTSLVALHPGTTTFFLPDHVAGFDSEARPVSLFVIPEGGHNHISGFSFQTGHNPGAVTMEWMGALDSLLEDCMFCCDAEEFSRKESVDAEKPELSIEIGKKELRKGFLRHHTLWVHGGSGIFKNSWSHDRYSRTGLYISDTVNPGKIYLMSVEHHGDHEVILERAANWKLISLQTEEAYEDEYTLSLLCQDCMDITFANLYQYRMQSFEVNYPYATYIKNCRRMEFLGVHAFSNGPNGWENAMRVDDLQTLADREIGMLTVNC